MAEQNLESLLDELGEAAQDKQEVSFGNLLEAVGRRSFGPALLVPGLLLLTPLGGIPGAATAVGLMAVLVAGQMLLGRSRLWLPQWLLRRRASAERLRKGLRSLGRPAQFVDRLLRPRLQFALRRPALQILAFACLAAGMVMPLLEAVPFADTAPGLALTAFGLALVAHDGLLALVAAAFCVLCFGLVGFVAL